MEGQKTGMGGGVKERGGGEIQERRREREKERERERERERRRERTGRDIRNTYLIIS